MQAHFWRPSTSSNLISANINIWLKLGIQVHFLRVDFDVAIMAWWKKKKKMKYRNTLCLSTSNSLLEIFYKNRSLCVCVCARASIAHAPYMRYIAIFAAYFTVYISKFILCVWHFFLPLFPVLCGFENSSRQKQSNRLSHKHSSFVCLVCRSGNCLVRENQGEKGKKERKMFQSLVDSFLKWEITQIILVQKV